MNCTHISDLKVLQVWTVYSAGQSTAHGLSRNSEDVKKRLFLSKVSLDTKFSALDDKQAQFLKQDARPLILEFSSVQSLSRVQLFVTPWTTARQASLSITNSESTQTNIHWVSDAIQPSDPLLSPSSPALNLSQHQGLFRWVNSLHQVAKALEFQLQHQSFQWIFRTDFL